ncbi:MAG TPA: cytochrome c [Nitrospira sp.]
MNSYALWIMHLLAMAVLLGGVLIDGETSIGRASADVIRLSQTTTGASGMTTAQPPGGGSRGEELYNASCVVCHGPQGTGGIGPRLRGNPVLSNDQAFWKVVHEGRHIMPPLKGTVSDQQLNDIRAWLRTLP